MANNWLDSLERFLKHVKLSGQKVSKFRVTKASKIP